MDTKARIAIAAFVLLLAFGGTSAVAEENDQELGIADLIHKVRSELIAAQNRMESEGRPALFVTRQLDIEISFVIEESSSTEGGFDLKIVTLGGARDYSASSIQKIRLQLDSIIPTLEPMPPAEWESYIQDNADSSGVFSNEIPEYVRQWLSSEQGLNYMNNVSNNQP